MEAEAEAAARGRLAAAVERARSCDVPVVGTERLDADSDRVRGCDQYVETVQQLEAFWRCMAQVRCARQRVRWYVFRARQLNQPRMATRRKALAVLREELTRGKRRKKKQ